MSQTEPAMKAASFRKNNSWAVSGEEREDRPALNEADSAAIITKAKKREIIDEPTESCTEEWRCRP